MGSSEAMLQYGVAGLAIAALVAVVQAFVARKNNWNTHALERLVDTTTSALQRNNEVIAHLSALIEQQNVLWERMADRLDELWKETVKR